MDKNYDSSVGERARKKKQKLSIFLVCIAIPVTVALGECFAKQHYMLTSALILIYIMLPFFIAFEQKKPQAREIVLIAAMTAITVSAHMCLHMTVKEIQIGTAIVVLSGVALGPEAGFLVGALSRFVCNFYMMHGPWTPWQMLCLGLLGFFAGMAFKKVDLDTLKLQNLKQNIPSIICPVICMLVAILLAYVSFLLYPLGEITFVGWRLYVFGFVGLLAGVLLQRKRLPADVLTITLFTFFVAFVVYGGLMNICALIGMIGMPGAPKEFTFEALKSSYFFGAPFDLKHAATAALCTFLLGSGMLKVLERVKTKYGIYQ